MVVSTGRDRRADDSSASRRVVASSFVAKRRRAVHWNDTKRSARAWMRAMSFESSLSIWYGLFLFAAILISGVIAGVFVAVQIAQVPVQLTLGARDFVLVKGRFERGYGRKMPPLVAASLIAPIPLYVTGAGLSVVTLLVASGHLCSLVVLVVTAIYNLPVNREAVNWDPAHPPADWEAKRDRWHRGQIIRLPFGILAFASLAAAAVVE